MSPLKLFLQFEGHQPIELIQISDDATLHELLAAAAALGAEIEEAFVFVDHGDAPLVAEGSLGSQGVKDKARVHVHRCKKIRVALNYADEPEAHHHFIPSMTVNQVKRWFVDRLEMAAVDASEHVLQITGTTDRPDPDVQIGTLAHGCCDVSFTLVPVKRVEG